MTSVQMNSNPLYFKPKDPISALTHFIGMWMAIIASPFLLIHAAMRAASFQTLVGLTIYLFSMILLYGASASYHAFHLSSPAANLILKRLDHISIFFLIAGSYTPICLSVLDPSYGIPLLIAVWSIAGFGLFFKLFWVTCPKWVSSIIYIAMGWACLSILPSLLSSISLSGFLWLLLGGIFYTVGGILYAIKKPIVSFETIGFGNHELFHILVMLGSICHYIVMYQYVI